LQFVDPIAICQGNHLWPMAFDLLNQELEVIGSGERYHLEAIGKVVNDLKGLGADRSGGAEH
jgi:hypothetical protein